MAGYSTTTAVARDNPGSWFTNNVVQFSRVVCGQAGSVTKIEIDTWTSYGGTLKAALFTKSGSTMTLISGASGSVASTYTEESYIWTVITLGTPYTCTNAQELYIGIIPSANDQWQFPTDSDLTDGYGGYVGGTYADFPTSSYTSVNNDTSAFLGRIYIDDAGGASSTPSLKRRLNILLRLCLSSFSTLFGRLLR